MQWNNKTTLDYYIDGTNKHWYPWSYNEEDNNREGSEHSIIYPSLAIIDSRGYLGLLE